ncbi:MAG: paraquat-inducible protein A [Gammaproteobacteria bacterium]|nr:paraquat-inducible protein A [Gammaproteobacteria bacterium]
MPQLSPRFRTDCHLCDLPVDVPELNHGQTAHCPRCGAALTRFHRSGTDYVLAFAVAGMIFLLASVPFDFLRFRVQGQEDSLNLPGTVTRLIEEDFWLLALIQFVTIFLIPAMILCGLIYLLLPQMLGRPVPAGAARVYRMIHGLIPWGMAEIFLIGVLVSLFKIASMADIGIGRSFYAFVLFALCMVATLYYHDQQQMRLRLGLPPFHHRGHRLSRQHTWALLATACVLYVPASLLPIMTTRILGDDNPSTIMGGVIQLWEHGSYPIAIIIFTASVFVPLAKILLLAWLNYTVHKRVRRMPGERMLMYRLTELVGRWSMVDVYVVALLVSLIHLGNTLSVYPGPAALAFCGVVVLTMLAAITFDQHLIWNPNKHERQ